MAAMKKSPDFPGDEITKKRSVSEGEGEASSTVWTRIKKALAADTFLGKCFRVILAFLIAWTVTTMADVLWFNHHSWSVDADLDFWAKTFCKFVAAGLILATSNAIFKTKGDATLLALSLLFFIAVAQFYFPAPYYKDGKPTVYVNSRTGDIYQYAYADIRQDPLTGRAYFLHPHSNDTCWNDSPENVRIILDNNYQGNGYGAPSKTRVYGVDGSPYTFVLEAGETLDHWITFPQSRGIHIELSSDNYDYEVIYSEREIYSGGANVVIPDHDPTEFFLRSGSTDQVITLTLSYY